MSEATVQDFDDIADDDFGSDLPGRPRRKFLNQWSAALLAVVVGAIGFYVGVRVEKSNVSGTGSSGASAFTSRLAAASGTDTSKTSRSKGSTSTATSKFTAGSFGAGFRDAASGGATGTVSSVDGNTIYLKETSGNTVKVKLSDATTITKSESVSKNKLNPGDTLSVGGTTAKNGTVTATSVTDSGDSSTSTSSSTASTTSGTTGSSAASVISSLFGNR